METHFEKQMCSRQGQQTLFWVQVLSEPVSTLQRRRIPSRQHVPDRSVPQLLIPLMCSTCSLPQAYPLNLFLNLSSLKMFERFVDHHFDVVKSDIAAAQASDETSGQRRFFL